MHSQVILEPALLGLVTEFWDKERISTREINYSGEFWTVKILLL